MKKQHIHIGEYEGREYKKELTFTIKGSRIRYYVDGLEVTKGDRSRATEIMGNLKVQGKVKTTYVG